ncbi:MAG: aldehyde dehydrogenase family protein, partial [Pseudomonadota bacterium]
MSAAAQVIRQHLGVDEPQSLIDGAFVAGTGAPVVIDDAVSGDIALTYADGGEAAASSALDAAQTGGVLWRRLTASQRGAILWQASQRIKERTEALATLEAITAAKPIRDARVEVQKVSEMFAYYAGFADKLTGDVVPVPTSHLNLVMREPLETVVQITPWNAPIFTAGWQLAPALAAGCAVVLKPSELTPSSSLALARLLHEAGVPQGAVNVVAGYGASAGQRLIGDARAGKVV